MKIVRLDTGGNEVSPRVAGMLVGPGGAGEDASWAVPEEAPAAILYNGTSFAVMMITPADIEDFAIGFTVTEGVARGLGEISSIRIAETGDGYTVNIEVDDKRLADVEGRRRTLAGRAGCGLCGAQTIDAALPKPKKVRGAVPGADAVLAAFAGLREEQTMNRENRSTHAAAFCDAAGRIVAVREDIGRHNALDKVAGALARERIDASKGFVILSSRFSVELAQKVAAIGAPFVASVSAPSALALKVADEAGLKVGALDGEKLMLFGARARKGNAA